MNKLIKTDHNEQALAMNKETMFLVREACEALRDNISYPVELRDRALQLKRSLEDPEREDKPAIFQRSHGNMVLCPDCAGTRLSKQTSEDLREDAEIQPCPTCKGEGQLYQELIRKFYIPTDYHRRKLAK